MPEGVLLARGRGNADAHRELRRALLPVPDDALEHSTIEPDRNYLLPMIKDAQKVEGAGFKVLSSPWTAPPWMRRTTAGGTAAS